MAFLVGQQGTGWTTSTAMFGGTDGSASWFGAGYTPTANGTATLAYVNIASFGTAANAKVLVYNASTRALVAQSDNIAASGGDGLRSAAINLSVSTGTPLILAVVPNTGYLTLTTQQGGSIWTMYVDPMTYATPDDPLPTGSNVGLSQFIIWLDGNTGGTPATLSSATPSGTIGTQTTATIGATTNQASGTLYGIVSATQAHITGVTAAQVIAGQNSSGAAAQFSGNAAVSTTSPSIAIAGLTAGTTYYYALAQTNANGNTSPITGSFTTAAATRSTTITLRDASGNLHASTALRFWTRTTLSAAASDGSTSGLSVTSNGSGVFSLTGLSVAAGSGFLTVSDPNDANNSHNYPVTFT